ncbi:MAG: hypothetical protein LCH44_12960 [Bacteroidetes bacterium]|jgi:hypothetical protein|nr:hypothetical protein [Bacteroidota bacterium]HMT77011.1 hypothetical protein [Saprospiraceae bacterium]
MKKIKYSYFLPFVLIGCLIININACSSVPAIHHDSTFSDSTIFIGYKIFQNKEKIKAELRWIKITAGKIKEANAEEMPSSTIKTSVVSKKNIVLAESFSNDVLNRHFEFLNDSNVFERKTIHLDSADLVVRMIWPKDGHSIKLYTKNKSGRYQFIHKAIVHSHEINH